MLAEDVNELINSTRYVAPESRSMIDSPHRQLFGSALPPNELDVVTSPQALGIGSVIEELGVDFDEPVVTDIASASQGYAHSRHGVPLSFWQPTFVSDTFSDDANIILYQTAITNNQMSASNVGSPDVALALHSLQGFIDLLCRSPRTLWRRTFGEDPVRHRLESNSILENFNVFVDQSVITNNQRFTTNDGSNQGLIDFLVQFPRSFWQRTFGVDVVIQRLESNNILEVVIDQAAITNNQRLATNDGSRYFARTNIQGLIDILLGLPRSFWRWMFGVDLNVAVNQPAETNNQSSFMSKVKRIMGATMGAVMNTGSAFNLLMLVFFGLAEIKSQGGSEFPFQTHPHITRVAINSMPMYALFSIAEHVISTAGAGQDSDYASIARAGRRLCLFIFVVSLASLFYF